MPRDCEEEQKRGRSLRAADDDEEERRHHRAILSRCCDKKSFFDPDLRARSFGRAPGLPSSLERQAALRLRVLDLARVPDQVP